jgi:hypothetical protein
MSLWVGNLFETEDMLEIQSKEDENSGMKWVSCDDIDSLYPATIPELQANV